MKFLVVKQKTNRLNSLIEKLAYCGETTVLNLSNQFYDMEDIDIEKLVNNLKKIPFDILFTDKKNDFIVSIQETCKIKKFICLFGADLTFDDFKNLDYKNDQICVSDKRFSSLIEKIGGVNYKKDLSILEAFNFKQIKNIKAAYLVAEPEILNQLEISLNNKIDKNIITSVVTQCFIEFIISNNFNENTIRNLFGTFKDINKLIESLKYFFYQLLSLIEELKSSNTRITLLIPSLVIVPNHLKIYQTNLNISYYQNEIDLFNLYKDIEYVCLTPLSISSKSFLESVIFDLYANNTIPIIDNRIKQEYEMFFSPVTKIRRCSGTKESLEIIERLSKDVKYLNQQKRFVENNSILHHEWSLKLLSSLMNINNIYKNTLEIIELPLVDFNFEQKILIIEPAEKKDSTCTSEQKDLCELLEQYCVDNNINFLLRKDTLKQRDIEGDIKNFKPTHMVVFSSIDFNIRDIYDKFKLNILIVINDFYHINKTINIEEITYFTTSHMMKKLLFENKIDSELLDININKYLDIDENIVKKDVCLIGDFIKIDKELVTFFSANETNKDLLSEFFDYISLIKKSYGFSKDNSYKKLYEYFGGYFETLKFINSIVHNHRLLAVANELSRIDHVDIYGKDEWLDTIVDNIDILPHYQGSVNNLTAKASEYKIFIYVGTAENFSIWELLNIMSYLKNTLVFIPEHMEYEISDKLKVNSFLFYNKSNVYDLINRFLKNEDLRINMIDKNRSDIGIYKTKFSSIWDNVFKWK